MAEVPLIFDETQPVFGLWYQEGGGYRVGENKVTKIVAYKEHGQMEFVPFFAVYRGEELFRRIPAYMVIADYQTPESRKKDQDEELPF